MKKQSSKWINISLGYISDIVVIVHRFVMTALGLLCYHDAMKQSLFNILSDGLLCRYKVAIQHVQFLLEVERNGIPMTTNHYFSDNLEKCRQERMFSLMQEFSINDCKHGSVIRLSDAKRTHPMSNMEHIVQDIHDILQSYYKVARKRYVDNVVTQATSHFLITGPETPLNLFTPTFVSGLTKEELEHIVGEALRMKRERARLKKDIASLTEAKHILLHG
ncbi:hypothetical protein M433DRAFT_402747 [Acidomyces richmondensis BFW]|nr:hypothetical protein M433DRAFT_402747 [Acidomyces richmondensis BFW]